MIPPSEMLKWHIPRHDLSGFPFDSPGHDPLSANEVHCKDLLDNIVRLSEESKLSYFEVRNGEGCRSLTKYTHEPCSDLNGCIDLYNGINFDDRDVSREVYVSPVDDSGQDIVENIHVMLRLWCKIENLKIPALPIYGVLSQQIAC